MRPTVATAVADRPVATGEAVALEAFVNRELRPWMKESRRGLNARGIERPEPVVSDGAGTYAVLWTSPELPEDCTWTIEADVAGVGGAERAAYRMLQTVTSIASTVAALGASTLVHGVETAAACAARIQVDAVNRVVTVEARDDGLTAMQWTAVVQTHEGLAAG